MSHDENYSTTYTHHIPPIQDQNQHKEISAPRSGDATSEDRVDLMELTLFFWDRRKKIAIITGSFLILGVIISLLSRIEYQSSATLFPETNQQNLGANFLRQFGGILGTGNTEYINESIPPNLYPDIVSSTPFQVELMSTPVTFSSLDTTITAHQYFRDIYPPSTMDYIKRYTIGLPGTIAGLFRSETDEFYRDSVVTEIDKESIVSLTDDQQSSISKLRNRLFVTQAEGLITLTVELPDPQAAAEIGFTGLNLLKQYVREYHTQKALEEVEYLTEQVNTAEEQFQEAQINLADFRDSNISINTAGKEIQLQQLQSQYDLTFNIYNSLRQNLEQAKLRVQQSTPVFTTVEPIQVPKKNSKPRTLMIVMIAVFFGFLFSLIFLLAGKQWQNIKMYKARRV